MVDLIATSDEEAYFFEGVCDVAREDLVVTSGKDLHGDPLRSVVLEYELLGNNVRDVGYIPFVVLVLDSLSTF